MSEETPVFVGRKPMSPMARVLVTVFCLAALLVTGVIHFATYLGVALTPVGGGPFFLLWVGVIAWGSST